MLFMLARTIWAMEECTLPCQQASFFSHFSWSFYTWELRGNSFFHLHYHEKHPHQIQQVVSIPVHPANLDCISTTALPSGAFHISGVLQPLAQLAEALPGILPRSYIILTAQTHIFSCSAKYKLISVPWIQVNFFICHVHNSYRETVIGNYIFDLWSCKTVLKQYIKRKSSKSKTKDLNKSTRRNKILYGIMWQCLERRTSKDVTFVFLLS